MPRETCTMFHYIKYTALIPKRHHALYFTMINNPPKYSKIIVFTSAQHSDNYEDSNKSHQQFAAITGCWAQWAISTGIKAPPGVVGKAPTLTWKHTDRPHHFSFHSQTCWGSSAGSNGPCKYHEICDKSIMGSETIGISVINISWLAQLTVTNVHGFCNYLWQSLVSCAFIMGFRDKSSMVLQLSKFLWHYFMSFETICD